MTDRAGGDIPGAAVVRQIVTTAGAAGGVRAALAARRLAKTLNEKLNDVWQPGTLARPPTVTQQLSDAETQLPF